MMGLQSSVHWAAWFAKNLILFSLMSLCLVIVLKAKHGVGKYSVLNHSDSLVILFVLVFYSCATITLCFAISVFFLKCKFYQLLLNFFLHLFNFSLYFDLILSILSNDIFQLFILFFINYYIILVHFMF